MGQIKSREDAVESMSVTVNVDMAAVKEDIFVTVNVGIWKSMAVNIAESVLIWEADEEVRLLLYWTHN